MSVGADDGQLINHFQRKDRFSDGWALQSQQHASGTHRPPAGRLGDGHEIKLPESYGAGGSYLESWALNLPTQIARFGL